MKYRDAERFINTIGAAARDAMLKTEIPASFLIAYVAVVSHFGAKRVGSPFAVEVDRFRESLFSGGYQNRWSFMLDIARWIRQESNLKEECTPRSLAQALTYKGHFVHDPRFPQQLLTLIKKHRLGKWDSFTVDDVRAYKREWRHCNLFQQFGALAGEMRRAGIGTEIMIRHLQAKS